MKRLLSLIFSSSLRILRKFSIEPSAAQQRPVRHWYPTRFLLPNEPGGNIALVILNSRPITEFVDAQYIKNLWSKARIHVCADGGVNKLAAVNRDLGGASFRPDFVCGDMDSARKEILDEFKQQGTLVHVDQSPDATDFTKCLRILSRQINKDDTTDEKINTIVTIGGLCGRFDHVMGCLHTLHLLQNEYPAMAIYLVQYCSLVTLLPPGRHIIHVDDAVASGVCGLAPIGRPAGNVTTSGLQWNLKEQTLEFGTLVSTSNRVKSSQVHVQTDAPLLWILNLKTAS